MIDHFTQYVGSSPSASPAVLCGIAHMQTREGVWYPMGGTRAIPEALVNLARSLGVEFRTECARGENRHCKREGLWLALGNGRRSISTLSFRIATRSAPIAN